MENIVKIEIDGLQLKLYYSEDGKLNKVTKDIRNLVISFFDFDKGYEFGPTTGFSNYKQEPQGDVRCVFIPEFNIYLPMYLYVKPEKNDTRIRM